MTRFASRRAVLFDLDGTLVDSAPDLRTAVNELLASHDAAPLSLDDVRAMIGDGAAQLVHRALAARGLLDAPADLERFRERYAAHCLDETRAYDGVPGLLARLRDAGRSVAVVTNKPTAFAERVLQGIGLRDLCREVVGPERAKARKPDPAHVLGTLDLLGAAPSDAVVVGDGETDVAAGRGARCATVAVLWGNRGRAALEAARPDALAASVAELAHLLGA